MAEGEPTQTIEQEFAEMQRRRVAAIVGAAALNVDHSRHFEEVLEPMPFGD